MVDNILKGPVYKTNSLVWHQKHSLNTYEEGSIKQQIYKTHFFGINFRFSDNQNFPLIFNFSLLTLGIFRFFDAPPDPPRHLVYPGQDGLTLFLSVYL